MDNKSRSEFGLMSRIGYCRVGTGMGMIIPAPAEWRRDLRQVDPDYGGQSGSRKKGWECGCGCLYAFSESAAQMMQCKRKPIQISPIQMQRKTNQTNLNTYIYNFEKWLSEYE